MNPLHYLIILRAHWKIALAVFALTVTVGIVYSFTLPKQYSATTPVVFDVKPDPIAGMLLPGGPGYLATQVEIIKSDRVAQKVVESLGLGKNPGLKKQWLEATGGRGQLEVWFASNLKSGLKVAPLSGSNIIEISYVASDPRFAALVANGFAQAYIDASIELKVDPARQYNYWFGEQGKILRENMEKAQTRLSEFQQQTGMVARDEQTDAETIRLNYLSSQLTTLQQQTADFESKRKSGAADLPEVMGSGIVAQLRGEIARLEVRLQEIALNLGKNHPEYQRMETQISGLKQKLETETQHVTNSFSASKAVGKDKETELKAAIAIQKRKLLELKNQRDQLAVLQRDVDAAQKAYDTVTQRFNQTSLESQATQGNVSVLTPAVEPFTPSSPNFPKLITITLILGVMLGCGAAYLLELIDARIRSVEDLTEMLQLPVLAVIERPHPHRLAFWRRAALPAPR